ncbi:MAG TPA: DUF5666 domain-containing protein [Gemmataceae bacterium]|jgi:Ca2+-binding RTX toxin-like protein|nr:DUF5666 domain-containing protein [Gemmataceae bacterium]
MAKPRKILSLESLNDRALPSATLLNGVLTVDGTAGRDVIVVRQSGARLIVKGQMIDVNGTLVKSVAASSVHQVNVAAGAGNDTINLSGVHVPTSVDAGDGNDTVFGGTSDDVIDGGAGNDRINGGQGNNDELGGSGDDSLNGGAGNDSLFGEAGDDRLNGQSGNDDMDGGADDDVLRGEAGDDSLQGGDGNDDLNGGIGDDNDDGGAGNDRVQGGQGRDHNQGGGGDDSVGDVNDHHSATEAHGAITAIDLNASQVTIQTESGSSVTLTVDANTRMERSSADATLADFQVGDWVEAKFTAAGVATKLESNVEGDNNPGGDNNGMTSVEGVVTAIDVNASTASLRTQSGNTVVVAVTPSTQIERNDHFATLADFQVGDNAEAKFDSQGNTIKLESEGL